MRQNLSVALVFLTMIGCTSTELKKEKPIPDLFLCSAFCYHLTKKNGLAREWIDVANSKLEISWEELNRKCDAFGLKEGPKELQKSLATAQNPGDDFATATKENSCIAYARVL